MTAERRCPVCGGTARQRWRPFCSRRCADVDLNRWLSGHYAIPVVDDEEDEPPPTDDDPPAGPRRDH